MILILSMQDTFNIRFKLHNPAPQQLKSTFFSFTKTFFDGVFSFVSFCSRGWFLGAGHMFLYETIFWKTNDWVFRMLNMDPSFMRQDSQVKYPRGLCLSEMQRVKVHNAEVMSDPQWKEADERVIAKWFVDYSDRCESPFGESSALSFAKLPWISTRLQYRITK